ncbi:MAG: hypothetical protein ACLFTK_07285 [Anaerolineales bacterium]
MYPWRHRVLWLIALVVLLAACNTIGENYTLTTGDTLSGSQHLVAVQARLEAGSVVQGDLNVTASQVYINGTVQGDLAILAEQIELGEDAVIEGDLIVCLVNEGELSGTDTALIWGSVRNNCDTNAEQPPLPTLTSTNLGLRLAGNIAISVLIAFGGALFALMIPRRLRRISTTAHTYPWLATGLGALTLLTLLAISSLWAFSLQLLLPVILVPFILTAWTVALTGGALGALGVAQPLGVRLSRWLHLDNETPLVTTMLGAGSLFFLLLVFRLIPGLAFLSLGLLALLIAWGLGATMLTRAGRAFYDDYHRRPMAGPRKTS